MKRISLKLAKTLIRAATRTPELRQKLLKEPLLRSAIAEDEKLIAEVLKARLSTPPEEQDHNGTVSGTSLLAEILPDLLHLLSQTQLMNEVKERLHREEISLRDLVDHLHAENVASCLTLQERIDGLKATEVIGRFSSAELLAMCDPVEILNVVSSMPVPETTLLKRIVGHWGKREVSRVIPHAVLAEALPPEKAVEYMGVQSLVDALMQRPGQLRDTLVESEDFVKTLFQKDEIWLRVLNSREYRERLTYLRDVETAKQLEWPWPGVVCSFPRSGSNFLQSILTQSSGLNNQSIYGRQRLFSPEELTLTVKSHAPSSAYLQEEYQRKVAWPAAPEKVIVLQRDPRDVMVSFFEYTQRQREISLEQRNFLSQVDYFYASGIDPNNERRLYPGSLNVLSAFQEFVRSWLHEDADGKSKLVVRYEDLVSNPEQSFGSIFDFLEIHCELAKEFLNLKVSLYDQTRRVRGVAHGWRDSYSEYKDLIDDVESTLAPELDHLGYSG